VSASSGVVFVATTLVASPVFLLLHQDSITLEDAVKRLLLCAAVCWIAISIVSSLAWSPPREAPVDPAQKDPVTPLSS
jgi:hypothetical protein